MRPHSDPNARIMMAGLGFLLMALVVAHLSCATGRRIGEHDKTVEGEFTVLWVDSTMLNYNLVIMCLSDKGPFAVVSAKDSTGTPQILSDSSKLREGMRCHLQIRLWEVMDQPIIEPILRVANLTEVNLYGACRAGTDSLAFLWLGHSVKTRLYRSDDIAGLYVRAHAR